MKAIYGPIIFHSQIFRNRLCLLYASHPHFKRLSLTNRKLNLSLQARGIYWLMKVFTDTAIEISALPACCAEQIESYRRFRIIYRSNPQVSSIPKPKIYRFIVRIVPGVSHYHSASIFRVKLSIYNWYMESFFKSQNCTFGT
jgi:hypothetical protein